MNARVLIRFVVVVVALWVCPPAGAQPEVVFESPNEFLVVEGQHCGKKSHDEENPFEKFFDNFGVVTNVLDSGAILASTRINFERQTWELPEYADAGTVFLNGFSVSYQKKDHHIQGTGAKIDDIEQFGQVLVWDAGIDLRDRNGNDGVDACIYFTGVGWNSEAIDVSVDRSYSLVSSSSKKTVPRVNWTVEGSGALDNVVPVPTAYLFSADDGDRHLLQLAYSLIPPTFANPTGTVEAMAILKDNDDDSDAYLLSDIDVLQGPGVEVNYDEFRPRPRGKTCGWWPPFVGCVEAPEVFRYPWGRRVVVRNIRSDFVVPVLVGFDLGYDQNDEHVKHIRASVNGMSFDPVLNQLSYRLTTGLTDKSDHRFVEDTRVMLIGFNRRPGPLPIPEFPIDSRGWPGTPWRYPPS